MLPAHLKRYVVEQDYTRYTPVDQEVWRYIMHQLRDFLAEHAHPCYLDGLKKTGIEADRIPEIPRMSEKLERFGWRAVPVSGFIPPAAFMELQALGYLPIASDMRTPDHILYTPAPDIVHEAAGHAPILIEPEYAGYLRAYAQVAKKAIISKHDIDQYEAIRALSDLKEHPSSTPEQIAAAERRLEDVTRSIQNISEAATLSRMNWWTAEYGLVGPLENPKLFGAGLLSSVGEATQCLKPKVKKIPLSIDCINTSYDITEPQPQLYVAKSFGHLVEVLDQLAVRMAFRLGGVEGLEKAKLAQTVNTVELNSGVQISGLLKTYVTADGEPAYLQFEGGTQLCLENTELPGHGKTYHAAGYGTPVGRLEGSDKDLCDMNERDLAKLGVVVDGNTELEFANGTRVRGRVSGWLRSPQGKLIVITFRDCTVSRGQQTLFEPSWGLFDMAVGSKVVSVFGGPADRISYGETSDFAAKMIPRRQFSAREQLKHEAYEGIRQIRAEIRKGRGNEAAAKASSVASILAREFPRDWITRLHLTELIRQNPSASWPRDLASTLEGDLERLSEADEMTRKLISDGSRVYFGQSN